MKIKIMLFILVLLTACDYQTKDNSSQITGFKNPEVFTEIRARNKANCEKEKKATYRKVFSGFCINSYKRESLCYENSEARKPYGILLRKLKGLEPGDTLVKRKDSFDIYVYPKDGGGSYKIVGPVADICDQYDEPL